MRKIIITLAILLAAMGSAAGLGAHIRPRRSTRPPRICSTASARSWQQLRQLSRARRQPDPAGIDLGRGQFSRPMTDDDLVRIIRTGIPNTPMPATQHDRRAGVEDRRVSPVAAPRRVSAASSSATRRAARRCSTARAPAPRCHRVDGAGSRVGPDLEPHRRARAARRNCEQSLLDPTPSQPQNRFYRVVAAGRHHGDRPAARTRHVQRADSSTPRSSCDRSVKADLRERGVHRRRRCRRTGRR